MRFLTDKLVNYRNFISVITVFLLLSLPITTGKLTLFFFVILLLNMYQFKIHLGSDFSIMGVYAVQAVVSIGYIAISILIVLHSLHIIKRNLANKVDISFSICMSVVGFYSLYLTIRNPSIFTGILVVLFFVFLTSRWVLHFTKS